MTYAHLAVVIFALSTIGPLLMVWADERKRRRGLR